MFLYARLVLDYISANIFYSGDELKDAINQLPETLAELFVCLSVCYLQES